MTRECLALAEALGQLPQRLAVHAMEVAKVALGASLSEAARPVLPELVDRVAASLRQAHEPDREQ
jgi:hydrogenase maturation protease